MCRSFDEPPARAGSASRSCMGHATVTMPEPLSADRTAEMLLWYFEQPTRYHTEGRRRDAPFLDPEVILKLALGRRAGLTTALARRGKRRDAADRSGHVRAPSVLPSGSYAVPDAGPPARCVTGSHQGEFSAVDAARASRSAGCEGGMARGLRRAGQSRVRNSPQRGLARAVRPRGGEPRGNGPGRGRPRRRPRRSCRSRSGRSRDRVAGRLRPCSSPSGSRPGSVGMCGSTRPRRPLRCSPESRWSPSARWCRTGRRVG